MNSRSNFAVISLACLCLLNIWSSSESRSRRDTALGMLAYVYGLVAVPNSSTATGRYSPSEDPELVISLNCTHLIRR